jgi:hypothetical protein
MPLETPELVDGRGSEPIKPKEVKKASQRESLCLLVGTREHNAVRESETPRNYYSLEKGKNTLQPRDIRSNRHRNRTEPRKDECQV